MAGARSRVLFLELRRHLLQAASHARSGRIDAVHRLRKASRARSSRVDAVCLRPAIDARSSRVDAVCLRPASRASQRPDPCRPSPLVIGMPRLACAGGHALPPCGRCHPLALIA